MLRPENNRKWVGMIGALASLIINTVAIAETLTIATWGGAYELSQTKAYFEPFTAQTGIKIKIEQYNGGVSELHEQVETNAVTWDLIDLVMADNISACSQGLLETLDHSRLPPALDGTAAQNDFFPGALTQCGVAQVIYATVLGFDMRAFPGEKPASVTDLFDLEKFPGMRGLQREPIAVLEWALRSYGVPRQEIYNLLSTERGLDLAFTRLDSIKDHIIWWQDGAKPVELLRSGKVVMSSGFNGRFFDAAVSDNQPIQTLWDSQLYDYSTWGVPRGAANLDLAQRFISFATETQQLAEQAKYISYGPARASSSKLVWKHTASGVDIRPHLPTFPPNFAVSIAKDHQWYAMTSEKIKSRFEKWLYQSE
jgi:putative spermidine/putrescine transport system substrate-binding protein